MTERVSTDDATGGGPGPRRQHVSADVAPELYDSTTYEPTDGETTDAR